LSAKDIPEFKHFPGKVRGGQLLLTQSGKLGWNYGGQIGRSALKPCSIAKQHVEENVKTSELNVSQEEIARRAYEIWQRRGCPDGDGSQDWQAAESELVGARVRRNGSTQERMRSLWDRLREKVAGQNT
jgi:hypothetical protein